MVLGPAEVAHGPMFIGGVLTIALWGISITQTYIYWKAYHKKDRTWIKYYVLLLFLADTLHVVFIIVYLYLSVIVHFDDDAYLTTSTWLFETEPALSGMISGMVQTFFGWRVKVLTGSWILLIIIVLCSLAAFLMGIATAIACGIVSLFSRFQEFKVVVIIWLSCAIVADMIITATLVHHLRNHRTGFQQTDSHIDRIIRLTIQTGLITAIWAFADLLVFLLNPTGMHLLLNCVLPKLYTNSLLSSLNSRNGWKFSTSENETTHRSNVDNTGVRRFNHDVVNFATSRPEVFINVESHEMVDTVPKSARSYPESESEGNVHPTWDDRKNDMSMSVV